MDITEKINQKLNEGQELNEGNESFDKVVKTIKSIDVDDPKAEGQLDTAWNMAENWAKSQSKLPFFGFMSPKWNKEAKRRDKEMGVISKLLFAKQKEIEKVR